MSTVARNSVGRSCRLSRPVGSNLTARIQPVRAVKVEKEVEEAAEGARRLLSTLAGVVLCRNGVDAHCVVLQSRSCLMMGLMSHPPLSRCVLSTRIGRGTASILVGTILVSIHCTAAPAAASSAGDGHQYSALFANCNCNSSTAIDVTLCILNCRCSSC